METGIVWCWPLELYLLKSYNYQVNYFNETTYAVTPVVTRLTQDSSVTRQIYNRLQTFFPRSMYPQVHLGRRKKFSLVYIQSGK